MKEYTIEEDDVAVLEKMRTRKGCNRFVDSLDKGYFEIFNGGYYIKEPQDNSPYDTELRLIHYCPFCGKSLYK